MSSIRSDILNYVYIDLNLKALSGFYHSMKIFLVGMNY